MKRLLNLTLGTLYIAAVWCYICNEAAVPYIRSVEHIFQLHRVYQALLYDS